MAAAAVGGPERVAAVGRATGALGPARVAGPGVVAPERTAVAGDTELVSAAAAEGWARRWLCGEGWEYGDWLVGCGAGAKSCSTRSTGMFPVGSCIPGWAAKAPSLLRNFLRQDGARRSFPPSPCNKKILSVNLTKQTQI